MGLTKMKLLEKIAKDEAICSVVGLGYVGLPLAVELAEAGFVVHGIDTDTQKIVTLMKGESYIPDVESKRVKRMVESGKLIASADYAPVQDCDTINICVPTPLRKTKDPDISFILEALNQIRKYLHPGMLINLESTTYPGSTEEIIGPVLLDAGLIVGKDVFLAFSPERIDPGNVDYNTGNIPKVVGGMTENCLEVATSFYNKIVQVVHPVKSPAVAEMVKLLENTFRSVNIGLVNELAIMCDHLKIDVWEVIEGAATKPFGFMPFYPGPGLGGHCIPIDPFYLSWKARSVGFEARFIELAGQVNSHMPAHVTRKAAEALNSVCKAVSGSKVLIIGVAYKKNVDDIRESPAFEIVSTLNKMGAIISFSDPYVDQFVVDGVRLPKVNVTKAQLNEMDISIIVTDHDVLDFDLVLNEGKLILDTRNAIKDRIEKVWRL